MRLLKRALSDLPADRLARASEASCRLTRRDPVVAVVWLQHGVGSLADCRPRALVRRVASSVRHELVEVGPFRQDVGDLVLMLALDARLGDLRALAVGQGR